jgi:membrane protease YdiL (CAAX protease family)
LTGRLIGWLTLIGIIATIGYASRFSGVKQEQDVVYRWSTAVSELLLFAIILGIVLWIARGLPKRDVFALRRPRSWRQVLKLSLVVFGVIYVVSLALGPLLHPDREQGLAPKNWEAAHAAAFTVNFFALAIIGPIVEELTFRGLGFSVLRPFGPWTAILLVGVLFGVAHGLVEALPFLAALGCGLAYLRHRVESVVPGMIVHGLFNALSLTIAVVH